MKTIVWIILEIFNMLNQYAVDNPTLPVNLRSSHLSDILAGCKASLWDCRAAETGRQAFGTHGTSGNVFANPASSPTAPYPQNESMEFRKTDSLVNGGEEWESNTSSTSEMPVWTVNQKFSHSPWGRLFKELWSRARTTAYFRSSFRQSFHTSNVCLLEDNTKDWGMYLFTISNGSYALDQRSGDGWFSGLFIIFVICKRNSNARFWSTRCEDCFSTEQNHPLFSLQKKSQSGGTRRKKRRTVSFAEDRLLSSSTEYFRVTGGQWFCRERCRPIYYCSSKWRYSIIRFEVGWNFIINDENSTWWLLGRIVQIKNTRVWESQDRIGIVRPGDSSEENRTWLSQIENNGNKKYRAVVVPGLSTSSSFGSLASTLMI